MRRTASIFHVIALGLLSTSAIACPDGQYNQCVGPSIHNAIANIDPVCGCLPDSGHLASVIPDNVIPNNITCAQWTANPIYIQTMVIIQNNRGELSHYGVTDAESCRTKRDAVAAVLATKGGIAIAAIGWDLGRCACMNVNFSLPVSAPAYLRCLVNAAELPSGTPVTSCDSSGAIGSSCTCPNFGTGGTYGGVMTPFPAVQ